MSTNLFGWELLFKSVESDIKNNQDVLVCFTHLVLISNGFKCIGLGDSKNLDGTETKSELLPQGWNENYAIRYVHQGHLYNLRATNMDDSIMVNLIRVQERNVSMVQLNINSVVQRTGNLSQMIPNCDELSQNIKTQLINKVVSSTKYKDGTCQTSEEEATSSERRSATNVNIPHNFSDPYQGFEPFYDPLRDALRDVGRSDLNPIPGRFDPGIANPPGGGMLFVPPRRPSDRPNFGIAPGSLPPGARFDPFRPPEPERDRPRGPRRPDNDEFPPPGFEDMFM